MSNFKQAIEWLKEGKKVRRKKWKSNIICGISDSVWDGKEHKRGIYFYDKDKMHTTLNLKFSLKDFEADDWEIYCEEHEWIPYQDIINENVAIFYKENPQFGWRGCPHPISYKNDMFCRNCGIRNEKPKEKKESLSSTRILVDKHFAHYVEKDVKEKIQNAHRRIYEVINMEWGKGMEYVLSEVREIFKGEFGDKLI